MVLIAIVPLGLLTLDLARSSCLPTALESLLPDGLRQRAQYRVAPEHDNRLVSIVVLGLDLVWRALIILMLPGEVLLLLPILVAHSIRKLLLGIRLLLV